MPAPAKSVLAVFKSLTSVQDTPSSFSVCAYTGGSPSPPKATPSVDVPAPAAPLLAVFNFPPVLHQHAAAPCQY